MAQASLKSQQETSQKIQDAQDNHINSLAKEVKELRRDHETLQTKVRVPHGKVSWRLQCSMGFLAGGLYGAARTKVPF